MKDIHIRIKRGDREIELSGDKPTIKELLPELQKLVGLQHTLPGKLPEEKTSGHEEQMKGSLDVTDIVKSIQGGNQWEKIYERIVRQRSALNRELLVLYFAGDRGLTAREISEVLETLGRPVSQGNIYRDLTKGKKAKKFVIGLKDDRFKLNSAGKNHIKDIIEA